MATPAIEYRQAELEAFHSEVFGVRREANKTSAPKSTSDQSLLPDDEALVDLAKNAQDGGKFAELWSGNWKNRYPTQSEADLALCKTLAFWTRKDKTRIDNLFRKSGLNREKWDREDYRNPTIERAVAHTTEVYNPPKSRNDMPSGEPPPIERPSGYTEEAQDEAPFPCFDDAILLDSAFLSLSIPKKESYLHPWLQESSICCVTGWRGVGKSLMTWGCVDAITKGEAFGPWKCDRPVNCLILDGEMACQDAKKRLSDIRTADRKAKLFVYSDAFAHSLGLKRASLLDEKWREGLRQVMLKNEIKVWVCDNVASLTPGIDENSKADWDQINQWLLKLRFSGITTILVHHEGKQGKQRGTSAREDNLDICISLKKPPDYTAEQGARFLATFTKSRLPIEHLPLIADHEFKLTKTMSGTYDWVWGNTSRKGKKTILRLINEGQQQKDIATACGVSKGRISQVKAEALLEGYLTPKGKLTEAGHSYVSGAEN